MYAGCIEMTVADRLALAPVEYKPIPIIYSPEDNEWLISTSQDGFYNLRPVRDYIRCDCHDLVWHSSELTVLEGDLFDGFVCDIP